MKNKITVAVVDDHQLVRQGIETFLSLHNDISIIASYASGQDMIQYIKNKNVDVVLMDLLLDNDINGIEAITAIKNIKPQTEIIVLTSYHSDQYVFPAFKAGALSYLLKDVQPEHLVDAIRKAAQGQAILAPIVANKIVNEMHSTNHHKPPKHSTLTKRELCVIQLLAQGLNNQEIANKLHITVKTVRSHVSNILSKLQLRDRTQAAIHVWQRGLNSE